MSNTRDQRASITSIFIDSAGERGVSFDNASIDCPRCEELGGWNGRDSGLHCPYGCGVRLVSTQAADSERFQAESQVRETIRRDERALRRLERERRERQASADVAEDEPAESQA